MLNFLLTPISLVIEAVYRLRRFLYEVGLKKSFKVSRPVICVGNLSMGGTGKTPFVIWLANYLNEQGKSVMVVTRGYKSQFENSRALLVAGESAHLDANIYGDEPLMIASKIKNGVVLIGKNRFENILNSAHENATDVIILDDGFQHLKIKRDLDIVLLDTTLKSEKFHVAPRGYLREGKSALSRANAIIMTRFDIASSKLQNFYEQVILEHAPSVEIWGEASYKTTGFEDVLGRKVDLDFINSKGALVVTGIAKADSFFKQTKLLGIKASDYIRFPDHYHFEGKKIEELLKRSVEKDKIIVCTEKDLVKLKKYQHRYQNIVAICIDFDLANCEQLLKAKVDQLCF
jgi:tetraacyldisaccharide 4'-kinase